MVMRDLGKPLKTKFSRVKIFFGSIISSPNPSSTPKMMEGSNFDKLRPDSLSATYTPLLQIITIQVWLYFFCVNCIP